MASNLRFMLMKVLSDAPSSGYSIVKKIDERTGWKPSYGSVYPLLESMHEKGLLTVEEKGRSKVYSLTKKGRSRLESWDEKKNEMIESMMENAKIMGELTGQDMGPALDFLEKMREDENPLGELEKPIYEFKNTMMKKALEGKLEKNKKEVGKMLKEMKKRLEKL